MTISLKKDHENRWIKVTEGVKVATDPGTIWRLHKLMRDL